MSKIIINISESYSKYPGPRYVELGPHSGEDFRKTVLLPALETGNEVVVVLDGTFGYGSSFLEEAFGGLVREEGLNQQEMLKRIRFISKEEPELLDEIRDYIMEAE